ncbi:helix-turn-helix domain-containing protein [Arenibaculum sp.]|jgi:transcriptional regulator with XRE-family HTH domain|uniref:helix-turn-helix domain-containing protein n=1 Tax=Arenibaculum sp. TaxID=2865862 RepID=UPI002E145034|nr:helix-turn-helix domain-containing protein [Arenibaculum sp.]
MQDLGARLTRRHDQLGLNGADTARRVGMKYQTFKKLLAGRAKGLPRPELLLRLCEALALTPAQALGHAPVPGLDDAAAVPRRALLLARLGAALRRAGPQEFAAARRMLEALYAGDRPAG